MKPNETTNDTFNEGEIYVFKKGELQKIEIDPDDETRKLRVSDETFQHIVQVQKSMRKLLRGHKPEINLVAEGLLIAGLKSQNAVEETMEFCRGVFAK